MTVPMKAPVAGDIMESVLLKGDIAKLTPDERVQWRQARDAQTALMAYCPSLLLSGPTQ